MVNPNRREVMQLGLALGSGLITTRAFAAELRETPAFKEDVASGKLPGIGERVPKEPAIAELETIGTPGGELRMLMAGPKDTRMMVVYGYARLVGYTPALNLVPDILKSIEIALGHCVEASAPPVSPTARAIGRARA